MSQFPTKEKQLQNAKLISPFLNYLRSDSGFLSDVESLRVEYGISRKESPLKNIPLFILCKDYWHPDFDSVATVNNHSSEVKELWIEFHKKTELLSQRYHLKKFPNLVKEFILTGRFDDALSIYKFTISDDWWEASGPISIKKADFEKIWEQIKKFSQKSLPQDNQSLQYPEEILKKYKRVKEIEKKYYMDQILTVSLIKEQLSWELTIAEKRKLEGIDKSKKSKLKTLVKALFSLLEDLELAE